MARRQKLTAAGAQTPAAGTAQPDDGLRAYRLTVPHTHAGHAYVPGDCLRLTPDMAARVRAVAGDGALVEDARE